MEYLKSLSLFFVVLFICGFAPPSVDLNNQGVQMFKDEKYEGAFKNFVDALSRDSHNPVLHFNLANNFHKNGENEKALAEFESVENSPLATPDLKFKAMFNAGNVAVQTKNLDKAMKYYQKALDYKPDSVETKTNIELALKDPQGGGGGGGNPDQKDQKDKKDDKNEDKDNKEEKQKGDKSAPRPQPKPFKSQALNENDVRRILEELKRQEQEIRAKQNKKGKNPQDPQIEKDW